MPLFSGRSGDVAQYFFRSITCLLSIFLLTVVFSVMGEAKVPNVLILNSYNDIFPWTERLNESIISTFGDEDLDAEFFIESLDSRRFPYLGYMKHLACVLSQKYHNRSFDLIIAIDDDALSFISIYGESLFRNAPVLFLGVNDAVFLKNHRSPHMTGMVENIDIQGTVNLALSMHPSTDRIILVSDFTRSGINYIEKFHEVMASLSGNFEVVDLVGLEKEEFEKKLKLLGKNSLVLFFSYFRDRNGHTYSPYQVENILKSAGPAPVYSFWDFMVSPPGGSVLGGSVISSSAYGHHAAEMGISILEGKPVSEIPVVWQGPPKFSCFNHELLGKYGLREKDLPEDAVSFNVPESFFYSHRRMIFANLIFLFVLSGLVAFLAFNVYSRIKTEKAILREKRYWESLFEYSPEAMVLTDLNGIAHRVNKKFGEIFGHSMEKIEGRSLDSLFSWSREQFREAASVSRKAARGEKVHLETVRMAKDGRNIPVSITGIPLSVGGEKVAVFYIYRDITEQKRSDEELELRLRFEEILSRTSSRLVFVKDMDKVVPEVLGEIRRFLGCSCILLARINRSSGFMEVGYGTCFGGIPTLEGEKIALCEFSPILRELRTNGSFFLKDAALAEKSFLSSLMEKRDIGSILILPLRINGEIEGVMAFENMWAVRDWDMEGLDLLRIFCDILGEAFRRQTASDKLHTTMVELRKAFNGTFKTMTKILEIKDPYTTGHEQKVTQLAVAIALEMGLPAEKVDAIYYSSLIHDIGKINIPSEILSKPGKLTDLEFDLIKNHAIYGWEILRDIRFPWPVAEIVLQHHERMDGSGYPKGLKGDDILLEAKIITVADVVEAMASDRPYRPSLGIDKALEEIKRNRGCLYMPEAVDACLALFDENRFAFEEPSPL